MDLISGFEDVEPDRIGAIGFSGGELIAGYTSAIELRVKATVLCSCGNTYEGSIFPIQHCVDNYLPGILNHAELPQILSLIAPRALFIESGKNDLIFPVQSATEAILSVAGEYDRLLGNRKAERFSFHLHDGAHEVDGRFAFDWMKERLM